MASNINPTPLTPTPTATGEVESLLDAGSKLAGITPLIGSVTHPDDPTVSVPVGIYDDSDGGRRVEVLSDVLDALDARRGGPLHRDGALVFTEVDSFIAAVNRWATSNAVVYAQTAEFSFEAVLDDMPAGAKGTAWRRHRAEYTCPRSNEWNIWTGKDSKPMGQTEFAEFIEQRLEDLRDVKALNLSPAPDGPFPLPLDVLQMARNLQVNQKCVYAKAFDPTTGTSSLVAKTDNSEGSTPIPRAFYIAIPVFDGGALYPIEARIRFQLTQEGRVPLFTFVLHRRTEVERHAFDQVRTKVAAETKLPLLAGKP